MRLLAALLIVALLAGSVAATVETYPSGIFRGSLRNVVTLDGPTTVDGVQAGDYLSFQFPDGEYRRYSFEEVSLYLKRTDRDTIYYDLPTEKYNKLQAGGSLTLDVDNDGSDDATVTVEAIESGEVTFLVTPAGMAPVANETANESVVNETVNETPECTVVCGSDDECAGECVNPGSCDSYCRTPEPAPENDSEEPVRNDSEEPVDEPERKGWFTRLLEWFAGLV